uniref:Si:ch73-252p3.1 n=1 Tax=Sparus aurata TaxID=8175 RepID=A0A671XDX8_SPAAU
MANGPALSTAKRGEIYVGSEIRDSLILLDVLYANQFEGESFDPSLLEQTEENFYRGAPPKWLNFYISEQLESDGIGTPFIKRDGYSTLAVQTAQRRKRPGISTVKLYHQTGCGGTTLAMQVLWDMRKTFRCAVLTGSSSDITKVAKEVVNLFTAGSRGHQNTVLLLLNDDQILENLQDSIMMEIAEQSIDTFMPVVIFFSCVRKNALLQSDHVVLKPALSDTEKQKFNEKKEELHRRFGSKQCKQFHGFNILQTNFSQYYVKQACKVICPVPRAKRPKRIQLVGFLSLLNAYVPGSYLLENQCLDLFKHKDYRFGELPLEDRMKPFSNLIITFQQDTENRVRMAHPMIAQCCTELMAEAGVTRSDTARNILNHLCRDEVPPFLLGFVKDMLTKREMKIKENPINSTEITEEPERFSRLILDIQKKESETESASVLKLASKKFDQDPYFPQALARLYYIELKDYNQAELWASRAKQRDPQNSFIADTLGQVHKNHLKNTDSPVKPRKILQLATKAIDAFKDEERLADNKQETDMKEDGKTKVSHVFNTRGQFGYLQVCNLVYDRLVSQNETWKRVLTKAVPMGSVLELLGDRKLFRFNVLIISLRDEVEKKCDFFNKYLTYSKPDMMKDDATYIPRDTSDCYRKYVGDSPPKHVKEKGAEFIQKLKQNQAGTSAAVLSCLDRKYSESELKEITARWKKIVECKNSITALINYIFAHIILRHVGIMYSRSFHKFLGEFRQKMPLNPNDGPEQHMLALLLYWPTDSQGKCDFDLSELIHRMHCSYENTYKTYFGSRHLCPLFFIGKGEDLNRIVHRNSFCSVLCVVMMLLVPIQNKTFCVNSEFTVNFSNVVICFHFHKISLQSEAGHFECSVSSLRWVCKKKVSFKYHFSSWDEHREKPSCVDYMPAGPLLDITVTSGKMEEVHLPHWIDHNSTVSDMFAVLHVDTSGDFVKKVSQVTSSHVKSCQPTFSPTGVMILKKFLKVKVHYEVLIYKTTKKEFLTLHVYLVPPDPFVKKEVEKNEKSYGSEIIPKPNPNESLQTQDHFLTADKDTVKITPKKLNLTYERRTLNYFEVFLRSADGDFDLRLESEQKENSRRDTVWTCTLRKGDYKSQRSDHEQASGQHFVERHRTDLINRVKDTGHILDDLKKRRLISDEMYDDLSEKSTHNQMRKIINLMTNVGTTGKDALYEILQGMKNMRPLISELEESG